MKSQQVEMPINGDSYDIYKRIRNFIAGRVIGITRDKALLHEVVKCLFCKAFLNNSISQVENHDQIEIAKQYRSIFANIRQKFTHIFNNDEELLMDPETIAYIDQELSVLDLNNYNKDPLGELYQTFIGSYLRMSEGQFFTPPIAIEWLVEAISPQKGEKIIDPACGTGGFLSYAARYLMQNGASKKEIANNLYGIEKDDYLSRLAMLHTSLVTQKHANIICGDSLSWKKIDGKNIDFKNQGYYDIILTNPPFGSKIVSISDEEKVKFELAHKWHFNKVSAEWERTKGMQKNTPPQVLFIEKCLHLLKKGGRMGIVVPESLISSKSYSYVVEFIRKNAYLKAVVGMPESLFKTSGKGGTHTKTCLIVIDKKIKSNIFMAEAKWCGHDSRGSFIENNDLPDILGNYLNIKRLKVQSYKGYTISDDCLKDNILAPRYYDPEPVNELNKLKKSHSLIEFGDLVKDKVIELSTGDEVGKMAYGTGNIPFIRTSDISNWEIKIDPKHGVSEEIYNSFKDKQDVRTGDILMVRDGTYLIGKCAFVSEYDTKILYQSHLYKIRVLNKKMLSPYLLLALLSSDPVVAQIKSKRFTQDIIDSIGQRINEIILPIHKNVKKRKKIESLVKQCIHERIEARELARKATKEVVIS